MHRVVLRRTLEQLLLERDGHADGFAGAAPSGDKFSLLLCAMIIGVALAAPVVEPATNEVSKRQICSRTQ